MNILITGVSGFVGKVCAEYLLNQGHRIIGLGRSASPFESERFTYSRQNILECDFTSLFEEYEIDAVVHLASVQPAVATSVEEMTRVNGCVLERMLTRGKKIQRWIVASSMNVYGMPELLPVTEESHLQIQGLFPYSLSKLVQEAVVAKAAPGQSVTVLRLASIFGKGNDSGIVFTMMDHLRQGKQLELYSEGKTLKELIHVSDVAGCIAADLAAPPQSNHVINVGYGERITAYEIALRLKVLLKASSEIICSSQPSNRDYSFYYDVAKLKRLYPELPSLSTALEQYVKEMQE